MVALPLEHVRRGRGEPLVLLHGVGDRWQTWVPVLDDLAAEREVLAVDLPGFGASPPLPAGTRPTVEALATAVAEAVAQLGVQRPHAAGNSLGGAIALELGRTGHARTVTALSPGGFLKGWERTYAKGSLQLSHRLARGAPSLVARLARHRSARALAFAQMYARPWRIPPQELTAAARSLAEAPAFAETVAALEGYSWTHGDLEVPTTVAWGEHDRLLLGRQALRARARMPRARHVWLTGCGHVPMWDDPAQVAGVLLAGSREHPPVMATG